MPKAPAARWGFFLNRHRPTIVCRPWTEPSPDQVVQWTLNDVVSIDQVQHVCGGAQAKSKAGHALWVRREFHRRELCSLSTRLKQAAGCLSSGGAGRVEWRPNSCRFSRENGIGASGVPSAGRWLHIFPIPRGVRAKATRQPESRAKRKWRWPARMAIASLRAQRTCCASNGAPNRRDADIARMRTRSVTSARVSATAFQKTPIVFFSYPRPPIDTGARRSGRTFQRRQAGQQFRYVRKFAG